MDGVAGMIGTERLAIDGGSPAKATPYGSAPRFGPEEEAAALAVLRSQRLWSIGGEVVPALEADLRALYRLPHAIASSSGTAAIHQALAACGVAAGDEVIVNPITDWGSVAGIIAQSAVPVFADIEPGSASLDPAAVAAAITPRTRAILVVHLAGLPARIAELAALARSRGVALIEDCAQTPWAEVDGRRVGSFGDAAAFSVNDTKHISCGEGGYILTGDATIAEVARRFGDKGYVRGARRGGADIEFPGFNYRMSELNAAILRPQLARLPALIDRRRRWARRVVAGLSGIDGLAVLDTAPGGSGSWWSVICRLEGRGAALGQERVLAALAAEGVPAGVSVAPMRVLYRARAIAGHAPAPRDPQRPAPFLAGRSYPAGLCPRAERLADTVVTLPCHEAFTQSDADGTIAAVRKVLTCLQPS
jgi:perosamine synthetase